MVGPAIVYAPFELFSQSRKGCQILIAWSVSKKCLERRKEKTSHRTREARNGLGGASRKQQVSVDEAIAKIEVSHSRVFRSSFAQKSFSILLDTHTLREQDHVEVSPFEARLPLRSPKAVSLKVKLHIERKEGTTCPLFIPSSAALPPVRRTGLQTQDASGSKGNTTHALLARCEWEF
jgi:hypothetical protein